MSDIAHLGQVTDSLDTGAKFFRVMGKDGVSLENIVLPINDRTARRNLVAFFKAGCPAFEPAQAIPASKPEKPKVEPTVVVELGEFVVNYDDSISTKLVAEKDTKCIGYRTDWATDEKFPDARKGKKRYKASAVCFKRPMTQDSVEWCAGNKKVLALPKDGIDIARVSPRPKLDDVMPLAIAGQFFAGRDGNRGVLCFDHDGGMRRLDFFWLFPDELWLGHWFFLVLEELPLEA